MRASYRDPGPRQELIDPSKGTITSRVSLAVCVDLCLGRADAKENDEWRLRYAELEALPSTNGRGRS